MENQNEYFNYLKKRRFSGYLYRKFWLYPILNNYIKGEALDIGCGIGDLLAYRENTLGVDINKKMIDWCKDQGHSVKLMTTDCIPFGDNTFDSVVLDNVLEHIENPTNILSEAYRVLKDNGEILVGVPGIKGYKKDNDHKVFYSKNYLIETLQNNGYIEKKIFAMPLNLKYLERHISQYCVYGVFSKKF